MTMCKISYRDVAIGGSGKTLFHSDICRDSEYQTLRVPQLVQPRIYDPFSR